MVHFNNCTSESFAGIMIYPLNSSGDSLPPPSHGQNKQQVATRNGVWDSRAQLQQQRVASSRNRRIPEGLSRYIFLAYFAFLSEASAEVKIKKNFRYLMNWTQPAYKSHFQDQSSPLILADLNF